uniref:Uncharacterized protein n=1 Tax=Anguilla anguilla TaxID=7936 RepID=A0A0E9V3E1_ANGAN
MQLELCSIGRSLQSYTQNATGAMNYC